MFSSREFTMRSATGEKIKSIFKCIEKIPYNIMKFYKKVRDVAFYNVRETERTIPASSHFKSDSFPSVRAWEPDKVIPMKEGSI